MHSRLFALLCCCAAFAQEKTPSFEVASIKPAGPVQPAQARAAHAAGNDPHIVIYPRIPMTSLLFTAFNVKGFQIVLPDWTGREMYENSGQDSRWRGAGPAGCHDPKPADRSFRAAISPGKT